MRASTTPSASASTTCAPPIARARSASGDRSERIRTYNFPQSRVTDHRINLTLYNLAEVLDGRGLDEIVDALTADDEASRLAELAA